MTVKAAELCLLEVGTGFHCRQNDYFLELNTYLQLNFH